MSSLAPPKSVPGAAAAGRFAAVGLVATVMDLGLAVGLVGAGWGRLLSDVTALVIAAAFSYTLHARFTLRNEAVDRWIGQPVVFVVVALVAGTVDIALFVSLSSLPTFGAKLVALCAAATLRVATHRFVLFRVVRREQSQPSLRPASAGSARLSVVIPAYREASRIAGTISTVRSELAELETDGGVEIVVVDDGSDDDTGAVARSAGADQVIVQPANRGKGAAVRAGVAAANGRAVAFTDADLAYAPKLLLPMVAAIEDGWDVVIGNRHAQESETVVGTSALRSFGSRAVNMATHLMLLGNYRDTQCGCKAFRGDVAKVVLGAGKIDGFAFDIEILHLVERYGLSLKESPVAVVNSSTSTVRAVHDGIAVFRDIWRVRRVATRGGYPSLSPGALPTGTRAS